MKKQFAISGPLMAKNKIITGDHMARPQTFNQHLFDKIIGAKVGKSLIEMQDNQIIDPQVANVTGLGSERCQPEGFALWHEKGAWMGFKTEHSPRNILIMGNTPGFADNRPVPQVDTIEVADSDGSAPDFGWQIFEVSEYLHCGKKMSVGP